MRRCVHLERSGGCWRRPPGAAGKRKVRMGAPEREKGTPLPPKGEVSEVVDVKEAGDATVSLGESASSLDVDATAAMKAALELGPGTVLARYLVRSTIAS